jgi:ATP-dependent DNA helicase RecQ
MDAHAALKKFWGFSAFRPVQEGVIDAVLAGRDALVIMATGSGKSIWCAQRWWQHAQRCAPSLTRRTLCSYQIPPLVSGKVCIVVSPLISLMQDQARRRCRAPATPRATARLTHQSALGVRAGAGAAPARHQRQLPG